MNDQFISNLNSINGSKVNELKNEDSSVELFLSNGADISAGYWRLIKPDGARFSSFDHDQQYGLKVPFNAIEELTKLILGQRVQKLSFDKKTGDLEMSFENSSTLQIFNFTANEAWEINFSDGTGQYSNYI